MSENTNETHPLAIPINISEQTEIDMNLRTLELTMIQNGMEDFLKIQIYGRARVIKFLTIIDIIFLTTTTIVSILLYNLFWLCFGLCPLCIYGYYGAKNYNKKYILGYICYLFIMIFYYSIINFYYKNIMLMFLCILDVFFLFYTIRLYNYINHAKEETIKALRDES